MTDLPDVRKQDPKLTVDQAKSHSKFRNQKLQILWEIGIERGRIKNTVI